MAYQIQPEDLQVVITALRERAEAVAADARAALVKGYTKTGNHLRDEAANLRRIAHELERGT